MKKLVVVGFVVALLSGCASMANHAEGNAVSLLSVGCKKGDLGDCRKMAMYQIKAGHLSRHEASDEFLQSCKRLVGRGKATELQCAQDSRELLSYQPKAIGY